MVTRVASYTIISDSPIPLKREDAPRELKESLANENR